MEKLTKREVFALSMDAYKKVSTHEQYSAVERIEGMQNYLKDLGRDYRRNKTEIFEIIEETVDAVLPQKVLALIQPYAEFKTFGDNEVVKFKVKNGKVKAVEVALGGTVERVRLDKGFFVVKTTAIQCKVFEEYERIIGAMVDWTELINSVIDAVMEAINKKIYECLKAIYAKLPNANKHTSSTGFEKDKFDKILNTIKAYGRPVIMGTPVAISQLTLDKYADEDLMDLRNKGYLGMYKGSPVVELAQSFEDESNTEKVFDDSYLFVIPSGNEKIVKVAMEGGMKTRETQGEDWTTNFEGYQKIGVSVVSVNHIGMYQNSTLK